MLGKMSDEECTPWDDFLSDFTLILDSGERIRCHKVMLANASPVMKTMLKTDMKERKTNEMCMTGIDLETATSLLHDVYASQDLIQVDGYSRFDSQEFMKFL